MRKNLPVSTTERFLVKGKPLVSTTDVKGIITYANPNFVAISGFSSEELVGKPHNIVRHPDMPESAFQDLWDTIKQGMPWRGLVKNRCKDGAFYWVEAYVTPLFENGRHVGYMSVRNAPDPAELEQVKRLYLAVSQGKASLPRTKNIQPSNSISIFFWIMMLMAFILVLGASVFPHYGWVGGILVMGGLGWMLWQAKVRGPLKNVLKALERIEQGILNVPLDNDRRCDLNGVSIKVESTRIHLRATLADVLMASNIVTHGADEVADDIDHLNTVVIRQSDRLNHLKTEMEAITASIAQVSHYTEDSLTLSESALKDVGSAEVMINDSVEKTKVVADSVGRTHQQIASLHDLVSTIDRVTKAINEIAQQTRLLSLNAAIEAARAGEEGRGFSVVAEEVRTLSDRTANSTADIGHALKSITDFATSTSELMNMAVNSVDASNEQIKCSAVSFVSLRHSSNNAVVRSREITDMLANQTAISVEIAKDMEAISNEIILTSEAIKELRDVSNHFKNSVSELDHILVRYKDTL